FAPHPSTSEIYPLTLHDALPISDRETDTEDIYFDLIQAIGRSLDLRIFVDTIAGASAGGINGVLLARALAHDLPMDAHRKMWLRSEEHTSELQSRENLVCRLLLE